MAERLSRTRSVLLIAETRPTVALGLKVFLADIPDTEPLAVMTGFDDVVDCAEQHEVGLIIVGAGMHRSPPLSELRRLNQKNPSWRLILLGDIADRDTIVAGLAAGARGIVPISVDVNELKSAIVRVLGGAIHIPNGTALIEQQHPVWPVPAASPRHHSPLTPRQLDIVRALAQGLSNKQIARSLGISASTVSMHLNAAFRTLGVHDRTNAALAFAAMDGSGHVDSYKSYANSNQYIAGRHTLM